MLTTHPDYSKGILDKEVEDKSDDTDEWEDGDASALPSLSLVQLLLGHIPARLWLRTEDRGRLCTADLQNVVPQLPQRPPQLPHVEVDGVVVLKSTHDICSIFTQIKCIVQNDFVTGCKNKHEK